MKNRFYSIGKPPVKRWVTRLVQGGVLLMLFAPDVILGDITFTTHVITDSLDNAWQVYPIDLDGDGDMDLITCAKNLDSEVYKISWYENNGSESLIFSQHQERTILFLGGRTTDRRVSQSTKLRQLTMVSAQSTLWIWMVTETWTCSPAP